MKSLANYAIFLFCFVFDSPSKLETTYARNMLIIQWQNDLNNISAAIIIDSNTTNGEQLEKFRSSYGQHLKYLDI